MKHHRGHPASGQPGARLAPLLALLSLLLLSTGCQPRSEVAEGDLTTMPAPLLADALARGEVSARSVTEAYLARIDALNQQGPALRAVLALNPGAVDDATALDRQLAASGPSGPLHGLPVLIKGNIDVAGLHSTAGSLALLEGVATVPEDAYLVARLREAGAVILGTANLSEWANFRDQKSSSGWSSQGGQTRNPHVLDRNPCGSSSGSAAAVAARLAPLAVGTETNGSIVCPAAANGVVGIKPTLGLVSRRGIIPISPTQDTAGPMAGSVDGAALLLDALAHFDSQDPAAIPNPTESFRPDPAILRLDGKRVGVLRTYSGVGERPVLDALYQRVAEQVAELGATLVDPIEYRPPDGFRAAGYRILLREFKASLNDYLANRQLPDGRNSLTDLIAYNAAHTERLMPVFQQSIFLASEAMTGLDDPVYQEDIAGVQERLRTDLNSLFEAHQLDALLLPGNAPAWKTDWVNGDHFTYGGTAYLAAVSGFPSIVLPAGQVSRLPVAVGLMGRAGTDAELIQMAYVLEQALPPAPDPAFLPTLEVAP